MLRHRDAGRHVREVRGVRISERGSRRHLVIDKVRLSKQTQCPSSPRSSCSPFPTGNGSCGKRDRSRVRRARTCCFWGCKIEKKMCVDCLADYVFSEIRRMLSADDFKRLLQVLQFCKDGVISQTWAIYEMTGILRDYPVALQLAENYASLLADRPDDTREEEQIYPDCVRKRRRLN